MRSLNETETRELVWILENIPQLAVDDKYRVSLQTAKSKNVSGVPRKFSDGEREAVAEALKYFTDMYGQLLKGYPKGHKSINVIRQRVNVFNALVEKINRLNSGAAQKRQ